MKCPVCEIELNMTERSGIEIDYCPQCRGVWLDRGELDKIIERSTPSPAPRGHEDRDARQHQGYRKNDDEQRGVKKALDNKEDIRATSMNIDIGKTKAVSAVDTLHKKIKNKNSAMGKLKRGGGRVVDRRRR